MNDIYKRQNNKEFINLLRTINKVYSKAKLLNGFYFFLSAVFPFVINLVFLICTNFTIRSILCFVVLLMLSISFVLKELAHYYVRIGSSLQQKFDLTLFDLGNVDIFEDKKIFQYVARYSNDVFKNENNWYEDYSSFDNDLAILYCQMENVNWTKRLNFRYLLIVILILVVSIVPVILSFIILNAGINTIIQFTYNLIPVLSFVCVSLCDTLKEDRNLKACDLYAGFCLEKIKNGENIHNNLIALQTKIYEYRREKRIINSWIYNLFYKKDSSFEKNNAKLNKRQF